MTRELSFHTRTGATVEAGGNGPARWIEIRQGDDRVVGYLEDADIARLIAELQALRPAQQEQAA